MPARPKKVYTIDTAPYQGIVDEFMASAITDAGYGVAIAKAAVNIKNKRAALAAKQAAASTQEED